MNKLPFKTTNIQGQSRQPNFQNLSIRFLTDWRGFWCFAFDSRLRYWALG